MLSAGASGGQGVVGVDPGIPVGRAVSDRSVQQRPGVPPVQGN